jgi:hypothetical protein
MDLGNISALTFTAVDGITQGSAAIVYLVIGVATWLRRPSDVRTRVFLAFSISNLIALGIPTYWWLRGLTDPTKLPAIATTAMVAALGLGALLLFHFTQVFPRRRPWIKQSGVQMEIAYVLVPIVIAGLVQFMPPSLDQITTPYLLGVIVFGFPLIVLLGLVLPVTAIVSLLRSHREIQQGPLTFLKSPLELILLSQICGGTLAVLFAPVLAILAPNSSMQSVLTVIIWALGLMTPVAYAIAVFRFKVLAVDPD